MSGIRIGYIKKLRYFFELLLARLMLFIFKIIPIQLASWIGGKIARLIGKFMTVSNLARNNIKKALPELGDKDIAKILDGIWNNLGRNAAEFIHITSMSGEDLMKYVEISDESIRRIREYSKNGRGGIIYSGHIGNWEVTPKILIKHGLDVKVVYRPMNNKMVDEFTASNRGLDLIPKGKEGAKRIVKEVKSGNFVAMLVDQKMNEGIEVPFFKRSAMTAPAIATLALKYDIPIIAARCIRIDGKAKFRIEVYDSLKIKKTGDANQDIHNIMVDINKTLEGWIKEYPEQWFWVHNRWKE